MYVSPSLSPIFLFKEHDYKIKNKIGNQGSRNQIRNDSLDGREK